MNHSFFVLTSGLWFSGWNDHGRNEYRIGSNCKEIRIMDHFRIYSLKDIEAF